MRLLLLRPSLCVYSKWAGTFPLAALLAIGAPHLGAQSPVRPTSVQQLKRLDLEGLLALKVTSVSRREETASHAAAAVEVVTQEQIERTGSASVPDALRFATGVQVSQFGGHSYALSTRGFTSLAANKLQVMQDGRSLYSPLFSGVFWDAQGTMLEDLDRIEVIRGPGATMWGANAVNGVINIISKDSRDTQGSLLAFGGGSEERAFGAIRHGGTLGADTFYRVYARFHRRDDMALPNGAASVGTPGEQQTGFRLDSQRPARVHLTLQGDYFENRNETTAGPDSRNRSGNLLGRWTRDLGLGRQLQIQAYYDRFERRIPLQMGEIRDTGDLDVQYQTQFTEGHDIVAGVNYRTSSDRTEGGGTVQFLPRDKTVRMTSAFFQDEITVVPQRLALVLGAKAQWESLDGTEFQPNVRTIWSVSGKQKVWAAASRAVRMPSRIDEDLRFLPVPASGIVAYQGNPEFQPEKLDAFELGYRVRLARTVFLDVTGFRHQYRNLRSLEPSLPTGIPLVQYNLLEATTQGVELAVKFEPAPWWHLSGNFTYLDRDLAPLASSRDPTRGSLEGNDASRLFSLWSSMELGAHLSLDTMFRYVGPLPQPRLPGYFEMDVRVAWRPTARVELALVGQNLLHRQHLEFGTPSPATAEVQRGFFAKLSWRF